MREIKFRFWHNEFTPTLMGHRELSVEDQIIDMPWKWDKCDQFTGLKDKNSVEIFEGDIFKFYGYPSYGDDSHTELNYVYAVEWWADEYMWLAAIYCVSDRVRGGACGGPLVDYAKYDLEVIGNIYENPELLK